MVSKDFDASTSPPDANTPAQRGKQRARSHTDKTARKTQLLQAAAELHTERDLEWTMLEVAAKAGLAKGTTYLYFRTKEELLLELLTADLETWFQDLATNLNPPPPDLASAIAQSIAARPRMVELIAVQASILEQNLSPEAAERFKTFLLHRSQRLAPQLEALIPGCDGIEVLQWLNALVIGLAQLSQPSRVVTAILEQPRMHALRVHFQPALERSLRALFAGIGQEQR
ncbi:MAG: TetR/AcrR family transcriptional regulator [Pleurocapsa sp. SU_196_0]|nr:TetR/AcrR family transcriptional regulator [Pleurocapsa sp. SU_196_0]